MVLSVAFPDPLGPAPLRAPLAPPPAQPGDDGTGAPLQPHPATGEVAVIDIGSNSVRLVVYDGVYRAPLPLFEDKVMCGLGRGLTETGRLNPDGRLEARETLARFAAILRLRGVGATQVVGTAALRDASDGPAFVAELARDLDLHVQVISGTQEAELAAAGIIAANPEAAGLVADIGGGSLDLALIDRGRVLHSASLRLGPYRLMPYGDRATAPAVLAHIDQTLRTIAWADHALGLTLFAVGGAWRTIGAIHLEQSQYPLNVINGYRIDARSARTLAAEIAKRPPGNLRKLRAVGSRRADTLPYAAQVLVHCLDFFQADHVQISSQGLREGVVFQALDPALAARDPVLDFTGRIADATGWRPHADALAKFLEPLAPLLPAALPATILRAALDLADLAGRDHPSYQADNAFDRTLRLPSAALSHRQRAMLALIAWHRHGGEAKAGRMPLIRDLLSEDERSACRAWGDWIAAAVTLAGGVPAHLADARLIVTRNRITLSLAEALAAIASSRWEREAARLAARLNRDLRVLVRVPDQGADQGPEAAATSCDAAE